MTVELTRREVALHVHAVVTVACPEPGAEQCSVEWLQTLRSQIDDYLSDAIHVIGHAEALRRAVLNLEKFARER